MQSHLQRSIWLLARKLVRDYQFSVLHFEEPDSHHAETVHLILERKKRALCIRLVPIDNYWPQIVERDVTESQRRFAQLTKRAGLKLDVVTIYVLPEQAPADMVKRAEDAGGMHRRPFPLQIVFLSLDRSVWQGQVDLLEKWMIDPVQLRQSLDSPDEEEHVSHIRADVRELERERERAVLSIFRYGKPFLTFTFLVINTVIYTLVLMNGGVDDLATLLRFGAKSNGLIIEGEWWRFLTPVFLHLGGLHFMFNMIALYFLGNAVERIYGSSRFFFIYILAGISGSVASFAFTDNLSAGASGAIFGCFGALLVFGQHYPKLFFRTMGRDILFFLGLNLALGFIIPNIDNSGHLGGLLGGYFAAAVVSLPRSRGRWIWRAFAGIVLTTAFVVTTAYGYAKGTTGVAELALEGQQYIQEESLDEALPIYEQLVKIQPENARHHFHLGYIYSKRGQFRQAETSWKTALDLEPKMPEAHYGLALLYHGNGQIALARKHLSRALELDPGNKHIQEFLQQLEE